MIINCIPINAQVESLGYPKQHVAPTQKRLVNIQLAINTVLPVLLGYLLDTQPTEICFKYELFQVIVHDVYHLPVILAA